MDLSLFEQAPPTLGNQYDDDRVLRSYLRRVLPDEVHEETEDRLREMGEIAGGWLYDLQLDDREHEPTLTQWDAWGNRIDRIEVTRLWQEAERLAAEHGLVATAYEQLFERHSRIVQFALVYLFTPSSDIYSCPLAMTDGAARTLLAAGNQDLIDRAVSHLASRHTDRFWTSGQWMTELPGGSDVSRTETVARQDDDGTWRLYGRKWFTSAVTSQMALALARPEGNPEGSKGLALFYVELRDDDGQLQNIRVHRLKDKLGTRKLPTAELTLDGTPATPVAGLEYGVRHIAPMLNITRTWNAVSAIALMRRGLALARDYAGKREAFGSPLAEKPLHVDTLADLQATYEGAFHLTFRLTELIGRLEAGGLNDEQQALVELLLRALTSVTKLTTAKQAIAVTSEVLEAFGGAGYVEDTGLPMLLRDAQVLSIWEGTTNVLALDLLRSLREAGV
ncbi:MAG: acyl-CoA dehydrogenase, partial [Bacteroidetes bacterium]|nr:acyl-CoA dehydrogenase [Bacteroidota bacterium]